MTIPYSAGTSFATPTCVGGVIKYPFANEGDSATKVYVHDMQVARANYAPLAFNNFMETGGGANQQKPVRSPFADDANAFWVGDSEPTDNGTSIVSFQRTFANVPAPRLEGNGIYAFTYPGISATTEQVFGTSKSSPTPLASYESATDSGVLVFEVTNPGDYAIGQKFDVRNNSQPFPYRFEKRIVFNGSWILDVYQNGFVTDISGDQITIKSVLGSNYNGLRFPNSTASTVTMVQSLPSRNPFTQNANSRKTISYLKSDDLIGIPIGSQFSVVASDGTPTDTLTATTTPNKDQYLDIVTAGEFINAESTKISRWMGNIWESVNITVEAL